MARGVSIVNYFSYPFPQLPVLCRIPVSFVTELERRAVHGMGRYECRCPGSWCHRADHGERHPSWW